MTDNVRVQIETVSLAAFERFADGLEAADRWEEAADEAAENAEFDLANFEARLEDDGE